MPPGVTGVATACNSPFLPDVTYDRQADCPSPNTMDGVEARGAREEG